MHEVLRSMLLLFLKSEIRNFLKVSPLTASKSLHLPLPVIPAFPFLVFQVFQDSGFDVDLEGVALVEPDGYPGESHFPAVQVPVDIHRCIGKFVRLEIVPRAESDLPFWCQAQITGEVECLGYPFNCT